MLWVFLSAQGCTAFSTPSLHRQSATTVTVGNRLPCTTLSATSSDDETSRSLTSRRKWTRNILSSVIAYGAAATILGLPKPESAHAASDGEATIYKTGKAPIIPGQKPKDKGDTKGTKKDPSFLRSVSDCKVRVIGYVVENTRLLSIVYSNDLFQCDTGEMWKQLRTRWISTIICWMSIVVSRYLLHNLWAMYVCYSTSLNNRPLKLIGVGEMGNGVC